METRHPSPAAATPNRAASAVHPARPASGNAPTTRGLIGHFANFVAMGLSRMFLHIVVEGRENIPAKPPYVLAANHETYIDGMWLGAYLPKGHFRQFCSLAASDLLTRHGLLGKLILLVGRGIRIDRYGNPIRGLILAKKEVEKGAILLVHPEGTRSEDGRLGEFKDGAAYVAYKAGVPMVPVFIDGGYEVFNRHMRNPKPFLPGTLHRKTIIITYGKPLLPADFIDPHAMTDALVVWMNRMFAAKRIPRVYSDTVSGGGADR
ncbi:MAG TPA: lysophospholipid acyltransferase family protein [Clostridia bacterium]